MSRNESPFPTPKEWPVKFNVAGELAMRECPEADESEFLDASATNAIKSIYLKYHLAKAAPRQWNFKMLKYDAARSRGVAKKVANPRQTCCHAKKRVRFTFSPSDVRFFERESVQKSTVTLEDVSDDDFLEDWGLEASGK